MMEMQLSMIRVGRLKANAYVLTHRESKRGIIIDPGAEPKKIIPLINGITITHILLTHGHPDHLSACGDLREATLAPIMMHQADAHLLWRYKHLTADRNLMDGMRVDLPGFSLEVLETPGHSAGSLCFYNQAEKWLFSGDTLLFGRPGTTQFPTGSAEQMRNSFLRLIGLPPEVRVYPGHGLEFTIGSINVPDCLAE